MVICRRATDHADEQCEESFLHSSEQYKSLELEIETVKKNFSVRKRNLYVVKDYCHEIGRFIDHTTGWTFRKCLLENKYDWSLSTSNLRFLPPPHLAVFFNFITGRHVCCKYQQISWKKLLFTVGEPTYLPFILGCFLPGWCILGCCLELDNLFGNANIANEASISSPAIKTRPNNNIICTGDLYC